MTYASKMQDKVYDFRKKLSVYLYDHSSNQRDLVNEVVVDPDADEDVVIIDPSANSTKEGIMDDHQNNASGWDPTYFQFETVLHLLTYVLFWSL